MAKKKAQPAEPTATITPEALAESVADAILTRIKDQPIEVQHRVLVLLKNRIWNRLIVLEDKIYP